MFHLTVLLCLDLTLGHVLLANPFNLITMRAAQQYVIMDMNSMTYVDELTIIRGVNFCFVLSKITIWLKKSAKEILLLNNSLFVHQCRHIVTFGCMGHSRSRTHLEWPLRTRVWSRILNSEWRKFISSFFSFLALYFLHCGVVGVQPLSCKNMC